jgi:hypothetical protein
MTGILIGTKGAAARQIGWGGSCAEVAALEKALAAGVEIEGGTMTTINVGNAYAGQTHGALKAACPVCQEMLDHLNITIGKGGK